MNKSKPCDYELVGFIHNYNAFVARLSELLNINISSEAHARKGLKEDVGQDQLEYAYDFLQEEISVYEKYRDYWDK